MCFESPQVMDPTSINGLTTSILIMRLQPRAGTPTWKCESQPGGDTIEARATKSLSLRNRQS